MAGPAIRITRGSVGRDQPGPHGAVDPAAIERCAGHLETSLLPQPLSELGHLLVVAGAVAGQRGGPPGDPALIRGSGESQHRGAHPVNLVEEKLQARRGSAEAEGPQRTRPVASSGWATAARAYARLTAKSDATGVWSNAEKSTSGASSGAAAAEGSARITASTV